MAALLDLFDRRIVFFGGKGGVGKTTMAAAFSLMAADNGKSCLIVSTDPAHSLGDIFGRRIGSSETHLEPGLWGLEIDAEAEADRHIRTVKQNMKSLIRPQLYAEVDRQLDLARYAPGAAEAAMLERVADLMAEGLAKYDLVVFDTAPTGHTIRLLSLPEVMAAWTEGMLRHQDRSQHMGRVLDKLGGRRTGGDELSYIDREQGSEESARDPASRIKQILRQRQTKFLRARRLLLDGATTAFVLVLIAERLPILESRRAVDTLRRFGIPLATMVINNVLPADAGGEFLRSRREQQLRYLGEIDEAFASLSRLRVPLFERDVEGAAALRRIAVILAGQEAKAGGGSGRPPQTV